MNLFQFSDVLAKKLDDTPIYLINYSEYYLAEFCDTFDLLDNIQGGWDDVPHRQGRKEFRGHCFDITDYKGIEDVPENAVLLILDSYPHAWFEWACQKPEIRDRFSRIYFFADEETSYDLAYRRKYKDTPLENIIVFRSGAGASRYIPGSDFGDNARALFEYMLAKGFDKQYELVWLVYDSAPFADRYKGRNVRFLSYSAAVSSDIQVRDEYYKALCLAKFLFFTNSAVFARNARADQIRVQLWHGCGFKSMRYALIGRDEYKYEYMTVTSKLYGKLHEDDFGLGQNQILVTGYPKDDLLFHPVAGWPQRFQVSSARKYIFWLPTWRTTALAGEWQGKVMNRETGLPILHARDMLEKLNDILREQDMVLVIKLHPWQDRKALSDCTLSNVMVLENDSLVREDVQINELLGYADALISDYSSVAVDYALLDRPIAFTLDDVAEYEEGRGFLWPDIRDWLPGVEIFTFEDFAGFVNEVANGIDSSREKRRRIDAKFHDFSDDKSSARVIEALGIRKESGSGT